MKIPNLNKPKKSWFTNDWIDNEEIIVEHWWLKPKFYGSKESKENFDLGGITKYIDSKRTDDDYLVVGTQLQLYRLFDYMLNEYNWELKDSWQSKLKEHHLQLYKENNNEPIILRI